MKKILQTIVIFLVFSTFASAVLAQKGPAVEFINRDSKSFSIAISGWSSDHVSVPSGASSLAVLPNPYQWVNGWYILNPGETKRFNRDEGGFYFTERTWENRQHEDRFTYFWAHKNSAFRTTERREKNRVVIVPVIGDQKPDPKSSATIPDRAQWGVQSATPQVRYTNSINPKNDQTMRNNGWAPFPFAEIRSGVKAIIFQNGQVHFQY